MPPWGCSCLNADLGNAFHPGRQILFILLHISAQVFDGAVGVADFPDLAADRDGNALRLDAADVFGKFRGQTSVGFLLLNQIGFASCQPWWRHRYRYCRNRRQSPL